MQNEQGGETLQAQDGRRLLRRAIDRGQETRVSEGRCGGVGWGGGAIGRASGSRQHALREPDVD